jgi:iron complex transport system substrate-binding protein
MLVALDELTALSLVSLGITPDVVLTTLGSEAFGELAAMLGTEPTPFSVAEPSLELLATFDADVFVGLANPNITGRVGDYEAIAPTVLAPLEGSWQDQLRSFAAAFEVDDRAEQVITAVESRVDVVAARVGAERPGWSISVLTGRVGNTIAINASGAVGTLLAELGVSRPEPQQAAGPPGIPFVPVSPEALTAHDADTLLLAVGDVFDTSSITDSPLYSGLSAVASGNVFDVVGDHWVLGGSAFATWWMLDDVEALLDGDAPAPIGDTTTIWTDFLAAVTP